METRRVRLMLWALLGIVGEVGAFFGSLWAIPLFPPWSTFLPLILIFAGLVLWFTWQVRWTLLQLDWKEAVAVPAVAAWRPGWELHPGKGLSRKSLAASGLSAHPASQYYAEDLVTGHVESTGVEIAEVRATRNVGTGPHGRTEILFQGVLARCALGDTPWQGRFFLQREGLNSLLAALPGKVVPASRTGWSLPGWQFRWQGDDPPPNFWSEALQQSLTTIHQTSGINFRLAWDGATLWVGTTSLIDLWEPPLWTPLGTKRIERGLRVLETVEALVQAFTYAVTQSSTKAANLGSTLS